ncbi:Zn finger containing protein [Halapricum desulfuricans]|uniref:Zn finger containing protein n=3 Tax=Halapricum desulfuricans TaxID=2841257 RepID=A0A897NKL9_9EURY|nr:Zn finger containing protein [Halapricum desulfuricans]
MFRPVPTNAEIFTHFRKNIYEWCIRVDMSLSTEAMTACPVCGSCDRETTARERVPGGTDWRYFECNRCGNEWRS